MICGERKVSKDGTAFYVIGGKTDRQFFGDVLVDKDGNPVKTLSFDEAKKLLERISTPSTQAENVSKNSEKLDR